MGVFDVGAEKARISGLITALGAAVTAFMLTVPDDQTVQNWGGVIAGVLTVILTMLGVYQTTNKPVLDKPLE